jgi:hypothetical protein
VQVDSYRLQRERFQDGGDGTVTDQERSLIREQVAHVDVEQCDGTSVLCLEVARNQIASVVGKIGHDRLRLVRW